MPVFEFRCESCRHEFERLVLSSARAVACPVCASTAITKKPSVFGMSGVERPTTSGCAGCSAGSCAGCGPR